MQENFKNEAISVPFHKVGFENGSTALSTRRRGGVVGSIKKLMIGRMTIILCLAESPFE